MIYTRTFYSSLLLRIFCWACWEITSVMPSGPCLLNKLSKKYFHTSCGEKAIFIRLFRGTGFINSCACTWAKNSLLWNRGSRALVFSSSDFISFLSQICFPHTIGGHVPVYHQSHVWKYVFLMDLIFNWNFNWLYLMKEFYYSKITVDKLWSGVCVHHAIKRWL